MWAIFTNIWKIKRFFLRIKQYKQQIKQISLNSIETSTTISSEDSLILSNQQSNEEVNSPVFSKESITNQKKPSNKFISDIVSTTNTNDSTFNKLNPFNNIESYPVCSLNLNNKIHRSILNNNENDYIINKKIDQINSIEYLPQLLDLTELCITIKEKKRASPSKYLIFQAISKQVNLKSLTINLENIYFNNYTTLNYLSDALQNLKNLQTLTIIISNGQISQNSKALIAEAIQKLENLKEILLCFKDNDLTENLTISLIKKNPLQEHASLSVSYKTISMNNKEGQEDIFEFLPKLVGSEELKEASFFLANNVNFKDKGITNLSKVLKQWKKIDNLLINVRYCEISCLGVMYLCSALVILEGLRNFKLDMENNTIGSVGGRYIFQTLSQIKTLEKLDVNIQFNNIAKSTQKQKNKQQQINEENQLRQKNEGDCVKEQVNNNNDMNTINNNLIYDYSHFNFGIQLSQLSSLTLDLSRNQLYGLAILQVLDSFKDQNNLQYLTLCISLENVSDSEFDLFAIGLQRLKGLSSLFLKLISIDESAMISLFSRISAMEKIQIFALHIFTNQQRLLSSETTLRIQKELTKMKILNYLFIAQNGIKFKRNNFLMKKLPKLVVF